jgi:hypothetical protein
VNLLINYLFLPLLLYLFNDVSLTTLVIVSMNIAPVAALEVLLGHSSVYLVKEVEGRALADRLRGMQY